MAKGLKIDAVKRAIEKAKAPFSFLYLLTKSIAFKATSVEDKKVIKLEIRVFKLQQDQDQDKGATIEWPVSDFKGDDFTDTVTDDVLPQDEWVFSSKNGALTLKSLQTVADVADEQIKQLVGECIGKIDDIKSLLPLAGAENPGAIESAVLNQLKIITDEEIKNLKEQGIDGMLQEFCKTYKTNLQNAAKQRINTLLLKECNDIIEKDLKQDPKIDNFIEFKKLADLGDEAFETTFGVTRAHLMPHLTDASQKKIQEIKNAAKNKIKELSQLIKNKITPTISNCTDNELLGRFVGAKDHAAIKDVLKEDPYFNSLSKHEKAAIEEFDASTLQDLKGTAKIALEYGLAGKLVLNQLPPSYITPLKEILKQTGVLQVVNEKLKEKNGQTIATEVVDELQKFKTHKGLKEALEKLGVPKEKIPYAILEPILTANVEQSLKEFKKMRANVQITPENEEKSEQAFYKEWGKLERWDQTAYKFFWRKLDDLKYEKKSTAEKYATIDTIEKQLEKLENNFKDACKSGGKVLQLHKRVSPERLINVMRQKINKLLPRLEGTEKGGLKEKVELRRSNKQNSSEYALVNSQEEAVGWFKKNMSSSSIEQNAKTTQITVFGDPEKKKTYDISKGKTFMAVVSKQALGSVTVGTQTASTSDGTYTSLRLNDINDLTKINQMYENKGGFLPHNKFRVPNQELQEFIKYLIETHLDQQGDQRKINIKRDARQLPPFVIAAIYAYCRVNKINCKGAEDVPLDKRTIQYCENLFTWQNQQTIIDKLEKSTKSDEKDSAIISGTVVETHVELSSPTPNKSISKGP